MTAKEFLGRGIDLDRRVRAKREQIRYLRDLQTDTSVTLSHAGGKRSGRRDKLGDITAIIVDLTDQYAREIVELLAVKQEISAVIGKVRRADYKLLLSLRYECFKSFEEIAVEMGYTYRHTTRLHGEALRAVKLDG